MFQFWNIPNSYLLPDLTICNFSSWISFQPTLPKKISHHSLLMTWKETESNYPTDEIAFSSPKSTTSTSELYTTWVQDFKKQSTSCSWSSLSLLPPPPFHLSLNWCNSKSLGNCKTAWKLCYNTKESDILTRIFSPDYYSKFSVRFFSDHRLLFTFLLCSLPGLHDYTARARRWAK